MIGTQISRYKILEKLGEGGMGVVYKALELLALSSRDECLPRLSKINSQNENAFQWCAECNADLRLQFLFRGRSIEGRFIPSVQNVVMKMSPKLRTVVILKYIEDLSYSQIAELLGCSVGTVSSRLNRSHKILARELKEFKRYL